MRNKGNRNFSFLITLIIILTAVIGVLGHNLYLKSGQNNGEKDIIIEVIHEGKSYYKTYEIMTEQIRLGDLLEELELAEFSKGPFGRFIISMNKMAADEHKQEWWGVSINGEFAQTGIDETNLRDGDRYTISLQTGFN